MDQNPLSVPLRHLDRVQSTPERPSNGFGEDAIADMPKSITFTTTEDMSKTPSLQRRQQQLAPPAPQTRASPVLPQRPRRAPALSSTTTYFFQSGRARYSTTTTTTTAAAAAAAQPRGRELGRGDGERSSATGWTCFNRPASSAGWAS